MERQKPREGTSTKQLKQSRESIKPPMTKNVQTHKTVFSGEANIF